jgi:hypothetical protein
MRLTVFAASFAQTVLLASQPNTNLQNAMEKAVYRAEPSGNGFAIENPGQRLTARFGGGTSEFTYRNHTFGLSLNGAGPVMKTRAKENRVEIEHLGVTEWFVNEPRGVEQGFTVPRRRGAGWLELALRVTGDLRPQMDGVDVVLSNGDAADLRFTGLKSWDANGRLLPSHATVQGSTIRFEVDDRQARYPVTVDPWVQQAELTASDAAVNDFFGFSVALSGGIAVVGAPYKNNSTGAVYVFTQSGTTWGQQAKLTLSDGVPGDKFGISVAVSGGTVIAGANFKNSGVGAAYVFTQSGTAWTQQAKLTASDAQQGEEFGTAVALSNSTALIGAFGAAYVFTQSGTNWSQQAKFIAPDGTIGDQFGSTVALDGSTALVGAYGRNGDTGAVYLFTQSGTTWSQSAELTASDAAMGDYFGFSTAVGGGTVVVGAYGKDDSAGAVYLFTQSGTAWSQQAKLTASDSAAVSGFGVGVAVSSGTLVVGASDKNSLAGAAYVFTQSGTTWNQQAELAASDGAAGNFFGIAVAVSGDTAVVGASYKLDATGAAYVFQDMPGPTGPPLFFTGAVSLGGGSYYLQVPGANFFGFYNLQFFPWLYHYDMGFEYFVDANDLKGGAYLYDAASGHWFFTGSSIFPYLYDFTLAAWIYYVPDPLNPGHYTTNPRKFAYTSSHQVFTM